MTEPLEDDLPGLKLRHVGEETESRRTGRKGPQPLEIRDRSSKTNVENPVSGSYVRVCLCITRIALVNIHKGTSTKIVETRFLVSFERDHQFVGREDIINTIDCLLQTKPRVALAGLGGVG